MLLTVVLRGNPATKKTSNRVFTNRVTGKVVVAPSEKYALWVRNVSEKLRLAWITQSGSNKAWEGDVEVQALFLRVDRRADLVNLMQALADLLQYSGVLKNDSQIKSWDGTRHGLNKFEPCVAMVMRKFENE